MKLKEHDARWDSVKYKQDWVYYPWCRTDSVFVYNHFPHVFRFGNHLNIAGDMCRQNGQRSLTKYIFTDNPLEVDVLS